MYEAGAKALGILQALRNAGDLPVYCLEHVNQIISEHDTGLAEVNVEAVTVRAALAILKAQQQEKA